MNTNIGELSLPIDENVRIGQIDSSKKRATYDSYKQEVLTGPDSTKLIASYFNESIVKDCAIVKYANRTRYVFAGENIIAVYDKDNGNWFTTNPKALLKGLIETPANGGISDAVDANGKPTAILNSEFLKLIFNIQYVLSVQSHAYVFTQNSAGEWRIFKFFPFTNKNIVNDSSIDKDDIIEENEYEVSNCGEELNEKFNSVIGPNVMLTKPVVINDNIILMMIRNVTTDNIEFWTYHVSENVLTNSQAEYPDVALSGLSSALQAHLSAWNTAIKNHAYTETVEDPDRSTVDVYGIHKVYKTVSHEISHDKTFVMEYDHVKKRLIFAYLYAAGNNFLRMYQVENYTDPNTKSYTPSGPITLSAYGALARQWNTSVVQHAIYVDAGMRDRNTNAYLAFSTSDNCLITVSANIPQTEVRIFDMHDDQDYPRINFFYMVPVKNSEIITNVHNDFAYELNIMKSNVAGTKYINGTLCADNNSRDTVKDVKEIQAKINKYQFMIDNYSIAELWDRVNENTKLRDEQKALLSTGILINNGTQVILKDKDYVDNLVNALSEQVNKEKWHVYGNFFSEDGNILIGGYYTTSGRNKPLIKTMGSNRNYARPNRALGSINHTEEKPIASALEGNKRLSIVDGVKMGTTSMPRLRMVPEDLIDGKTDDLDGGTDVWFREDKDDTTKVTSGKLLWKCLALTGMPYNTQVKAVGRVIIDGKDIPIESVLITPPTQFDHDSGNVLLTFNKFFNITAAGHFFKTNEFKYPGILFRHDHEKDGFLMDAVISNTYKGNEKTFTMNGFKTNTDNKLFHPDSFVITDSILMTQDILVLGTTGGHISSVNTKNGSYTTYDGKNIGVNVPLYSYCGTGKDRGDILKLYNMDGTLYAIFTKGYKALYQRVRNKDNGTTETYTVDFPISMDADTEITASCRVNKRIYVAGYHPSEKHHFLTYIDVDDRGNPTSYQDCGYSKEAGGAKITAIEQIPNTSDENVTLMICFDNGFISTYVSNSVQNTDGTVGVFAPTANIDDVRDICTSRAVIGINKSPLKHVQRIDIEGHDLILSGKENSARWAGDVGCMFDCDIDNIVETDNNLIGDIPMYLQGAGVASFGRYIVFTNGFNPYSSNPFKSVHNGICVLDIVTKKFAILKDMRQSPIDTNGTIWAAIYAPIQTNKSDKGVIINKANWMIASYKKDANNVYTNEITLANETIKWERINITDGTVGAYGFNGWTKGKIIHINEGNAGHVWVEENGSGNRFSGVGAGVETTADNSVIVSEWNPITSQYDYIGYNPTTNTLSRGSSASANIPNLGTTLKIPSLCKDSKPVSISTPVFGHCVVCFDNGVAVEYVGTTIKRISFKTTRGFTAFNECDEYKISGIHIANAVTTNNNRYIRLGDSFPIKASKDNCLLGYKLLTMSDDDYLVATDTHPLGAFEKSEQLHTSSFDECPHYEKSVVCDDGTLFILSSNGFMGYAELSEKLYADVEVIASGSDNNDDPWILTKDKLISFKRNSNSYEVFAGTFDEDEKDVVYYTTDKIHNVIHVYTKEYNHNITFFDNSFVDNKAKLLDSVAILGARYTEKYEITYKRTVDNKIKLCSEALNDCGIVEKYNDESDDKSVILERDNTSLEVIKIVPFADTNMLGIVERIPDESKYRLSLFKNDVLIDSVIADTYSAKNTGFEILSITPDNAIVLTSRVENDVYILESKSIRWQYNKYEIISNGIDIGTHKKICTTGDEKEIYVISGNELYEIERATNVISKIATVPYLDGKTITSICVNNHTHVLSIVDNAGGMYRFNYRTKVFEIVRVKNEELEREQRHNVTCNRKRTVTYISNSNTLCVVRNDSNTIKIMKSFTNVPENSESLALKYIEDNNTLRYALYDYDNKSINIYTIDLNAVEAKQTQCLENRDLTAVTFTDKGVAIVNTNNATFEMYYDGRLIGKSQFAHNNKMVLNSDIVTICSYGNNMSYVVFDGAYSSMIFGILPEPARDAISVDERLMSVRTIDDDLNNKYMFYYGGEYYYYNNKEIHKFNPVTGEFELFDTVHNDDETYETVSLRVYEGNLYICEVKNVYYVTLTSYSLRTKQLIKSLNVHKISIARTDYSDIEIVFAKSSIWSGHYLITSYTLVGEEIITETGEKTYGNKRVVLKVDVLKTVNTTEAYNLLEEQIDAPYGKDLTSAVQPYMRLDCDKTVESDTDLTVGVNGLSTTLFKNNEDDSWSKRANLIPIHDNGLLVQTPKGIELRTRYEVKPVASFGCGLYNISIFTGPTQDVYICRHRITGEVTSRVEVSHHYGITINGYNIFTAYTSTVSKTETKVVETISKDEPAVFLIRHSQPAISELVVDFEGNMTVKSYDGNMYGFPMNCGSNIHTLQEVDLTMLFDNELSELGLRRIPLE